MKIKHLKLYCANLDELRFFYTRKFNFPVVHDEGDQLTLKIGASLLTFEENRIHKSYYHFAFNVPYGSEKKLTNWVHKKVDLIHKEGKIVQDFEDWKAKSIYFLDPAGNVVEFIGREEFNRDKVPAYSEEAVLNISEIGIPVFEVSSAFKAIEHATGIEKFDCDANMFCAAGDHEGLMILVDSAERSWYPTDDPARAFNLSMEFEVKGNSFELIYNEGDLEIEDLKKVSPAKS